MESPVAIRSRISQRRSTSTNHGLAPEAAQLLREILGALGPELQVVVARRGEPDKDTPTPAIKLPAGAVVFQLKEPKKTGRQLKVTFQSIIGFLNIVGAQEKRPPLEAVTPTIGGATIVSTRYLTEDSGEAEKEAEIYYNFTPSIALAADRFIISSTRGLAVRLARLVQKQSSGKPDASQAARADNAAIRLNVQGVRQALTENRRHLVAQNMVAKGHDRKAAEKEIDTLLYYVGLVRDVSLQLATEKKSLRLDLSVRFAQEK